jgi:hypothetical protein
MDTDDVLGFAKKAIPWIGAAATGNIPALIQMAADAVGGVLGKDVEASSAAIASAVAGATPAEIIALRTADNDFKLRMQELGYKELVDLERIAADDRASARKMRTETNSWVPDALSVVIVLAWIGIQCFLLGHVVDQSMREVTARILGTLDTALVIVLTFHFGSNRSSARKTELLSQSSPTSERK